MFQVGTPKSWTLTTSCPIRLLCSTVPLRKKETRMKGLRVIFSANLPVLARVHLSAKVCSKKKKEKDLTLIIRLVLPLRLCTTTFFAALPVALLHHLLTL